MRLLVAGGGTGGHVFPGMALAEEVVTRHPRNDAVFVGTGRGLEARVVPEAGFPIEFVDVRGLKGQGPAALLRNLARLPGALLQSLAILRRWRPDVVVGVGGYASGPVVLAAWLLRIPTAVQEQNAVAGLTNRVLGRLVRAAFTAFPEAGPDFPRRKVHQLGNPIRRELLDNFMRPAAEHPAPRVLVLGGSQGAHALKMRVVETLPHLADLRDTLRVTHQTGARDRDPVERGYRAVGFTPDAREFIEDMSRAYAEADLVVCRAGATTLAELTALGKPAILVPFPFAADDHQRHNALALVRAGAALMLDQAGLRAEVLTRELAALLGDDSRRREMGRAARGLARPAAAETIVSECLALAERRGGSHVQKK